MVELFLYIISSIFVISAISLTIGGGVCLFHYHKYSQECYLTFSIGICLFMLILAITFMICIINYLDNQPICYPPSSLYCPLPFRLIWESSPSGPILPLSSSPNALSRNQKTRMKP